MMLWIRLFCCCIEPSNKKDEHYGIQIYDWCKIKNYMFISSRSILYKSVSQINLKEYRKTNAGCKILNKRFADSGAKQPCGGVQAPR